jgi:hypothetical protein
MHTPRAASNLEQSSQSKKTTMENASQSSTDFPLKLVVIMDEDGHFEACPWYDRHRVIKLLRKIPDAWENVEIDISDFDASQEQHITNEEAISYSDKDFENFVHRFVQRGQCEIVDMKL